MQYKIVGDIEQGIHYTRFIEELEDEQQKDQVKKSEKSESEDLLIKENLVNRSSSS